MCCYGLTIKPGVTDRIEITTDNTGPDIDGIENRLVLRGLQKKRDGQLEWHDFGQKNRKKWPKILSDTLA